jgi:cell wall-associated NlpC family hydrolase
VPAGADPIADKKAQAAELARTIDAKGEAVSRLAEQVNQARLNAAGLTAKLSRAQADMAAGQRHAAEVRSRLMDQVVASYVRGGRSMELTSPVGDGFDVAVQRTYVATMTSGEKDALDQLRAVHLELVEERAKLEAAAKAAADSLAQVAGSQREAARAVADEQAALGKVKGDLASLVAAEQERQAAAQAARAQAEQAARQARQAQEAAAAAAAHHASPPPIVGGLLSRVPAPSAKRPAPTVEAPVAPGAAGAVEEARRQLGKPYVYGAAGPDSFDCSGLTMWAWGHAGVSMSHSAAAQYGEFPHVSTDSLQPGDLIFYGSPIHHVGMYVGGGQMIEASHTGTPVRYASIWRSDMVGASRP